MKMIICKQNGQEVKELVKFLRAMELMEAVVKQPIGEFEVEDLVYVGKEKALGMVIAIDEMDTEYPYLVRVGENNEWFAEYELELVDIDRLLDIGKERLKEVQELEEL